MNYYNEFDKKSAAWLRELIAEGLIPKGEVDERDIRDVAPSDLEGFVQCHFFAGIGGWPYALRLAGWPEDMPVWTGSCPCQPFSVAGQGKGINDERHLWPAFRWLIAQRRPSIVFGEQVASKDGREWLSGVRTDLECMGYAVGAADLCAAGVGAPHIRQRLWWVADNSGAGYQGCERSEPDSKQNRFRSAGPHGTTREFCAYDVDWSRSVWWPCRDGKLRRVPARGVADCEHRGSQAGRAEGNESCGIVNDENMRSETAELCTTRWLGNASGRETHAAEQGQQQPGNGCRTCGVWDSEHERQHYNGYAGLEVEPALFPLADGIPGRVGLLRGAGNAIVPAVAKAFIEAYVETQMCYAKEAD